MPPTGGTEIGEAQDPLWLVAVRRYLARYGRGLLKEDLDDLAQDVAVFIAQFDRAGIVLDSDEAMAITIARRVLRDSRRRMARSPRAELPESTKKPDLDRPWAELMDLLVTLPAEERHLAELRLEGQSFIEIARGLKVSVAKIHGMLQRLRRHLRALLARSGIAVPEPGPKKKRKKN